MVFGPIGSDLGSTETVGAENRSVDIDLISLTRFRAREAEFLGVFLRKAEMEILFLTLTILRKTQRKATSRARNRLSEIKSISTDRFSAPTVPLEPRSEPIGSKTIQN